METKEYLQKLKDSSIGGFQNLEVDLVAETIDFLKDHNLTIGQTTKLFSTVSLILADMTEI